MGWGAHPGGDTAQVTIVRLQIVGGGRMGQALLEGLLKAGHRGKHLSVAERDPASRAGLSARFSRRGVAVVEVPVASQASVLATKPQDIEAACRAVAEAGCRRVLSIAAGVPTAKLEGWLGGGVAVVRSMPNTPAQVGAGAAAIAAGREAGVADLEWAESVLGAVGRVVRVSEDQLDAVTAVSGSGPAYVFFLAEALEDAAVSAGLDPEVAVTLARQTVIGAGRLLAESPESAAALREAVTSPGGTTAAGLEVLRERGLAEAVTAAVTAAAARSKQLGEL